MATRYLSKKIDNVGDKVDTVETKVDALKKEIKEIKKDDNPTGFSKPAAPNDEQLSHQ